MKQRSGEKIVKRGVSATTPFRYSRRTLPCSYCTSENVRYCLAPVFQQVDDLLNPPLHRDFGLSSFLTSREPPTCSPLYGGHPDDGRVLELPGSDRNLLNHAEAAENFLVFSVSLATWYKAPKSDWDRVLHSPLTFRLLCADCQSVLYGSLPYMHLSYQDLNDFVAVGLFEHGYHS